MSEGLTQYINALVPVIDNQIEKSSTKERSYKLAAGVLMTLAPIVFLLGIILGYPGMAVSGAAVAILAFVVRDLSRYEKTYRDVFLNDRKNMANIMQVLNQDNIKNNIEVEILKGQLEKIVQ